MITIALNKKKGFTLDCGACYEDLVKAIFTCPSKIFISKNYKKSLITFEDAFDAIHGPMKISFVKSDDRFARVYNKKGFKLALIIDDSPAFKLALH